MTETVPGWIIYWCVHIHSQGKLIQSKWRRMMLLCMVEMPICNVVFSLESRNKQVSFFETFLYENEAPSLEQAAVVTTTTRVLRPLKRAFFCVPPECLAAYKTLKGGWKFSFPKMFHSYRDLFLIISLENCHNTTWLACRQRWSANLISACRHSTAQKYTVFSFADWKWIFVYISCWGVS